MPEAAQPRELSREEIAAILKRHHGSQKQVAEKSGRSHVTVSQVLAGRVTSKHVMDTAREYALALLAEEKKAKAA